MTKERIKSFDLIRCICMLGIVQEHFLLLCRSYNVNFKFLEKINYYGNLGWGGVGTAIFFMISGSTLIYNYEDKEESIIDFYISRFIKMCPLLYFLHIVFYLIYSIIQNKLLYIPTLNNIFETLIGKALVGEWFTMVIFTCYILFPLLKYLYKKHKIITTILLFTLFILNQHYLFLSMGSKWSSYTNGIFEFWIGMILIGTKNRIPKKLMPILIISLMLMPRFSLLFDLNGIWFYIPTIICSVILFLLLLQTDYDNYFVNKISKYSYEIYLIHHQVMYLLFPIFIVLIKTQKQYVLFLICILGIVYVASEKINVLNSKFLNIVRPILQLK